MQLFVSNDVTLTDFTVNKLQQDATLTSIIGGWLICSSEIYSLSQKRVNNLVALSSLNEATIRFDMMNLRMLFKGSQVA